MYSSQRLLANQGWTTQYSLHFRLGEKDFYGMVMLAKWFSIQSWLLSKAEQPNLFYYLARRLVKKGFLLDGVANQMVLHSELSIS